MIRQSRKVMVIRELGLVSFWWQYVAYIWIALAYTMAQARVR